MAAALCAAATLWVTGAAANGRYPASTQIAFSTDVADPDLVVVRAVLPKPAPRDETAVIPSDWRTVPAPHSTRAFGDAWIQRGATLAIAVPSVILPAPPAWRSASTSRKNG